MPIRPLLAALILGAVFYFVGVGQVLSALANVSWLDVVLLLLISLVMIWLSSAKWALFVRASGNKVSTLKLMRYYTEGYFYNSFLPSYIGGDIARSYSLGKEIGNQRTAAAATLLERLSGLLAMSFLGVVSILFGAEFNMALNMFLVFIFILVSGVLIVLSTKAGVRLLSKFCPKFLEDEFSRLDAASEFIRNKPRVWLLSLGWSLLFHIATVVNTIFAANAVGWTAVPFGDLFVVLPVVLLLAAIPITPSGIGIQESAFLFFLPLLGATQAQAVGVGIVLRIKVLFLALVGGLLWARK